ncbi:hypothetical protein LCGC14_2806110, partial [marine sediment metagenome]
IKLNLLKLLILNLLKNLLNPNIIREIKKRGKKKSIYFMFLIQIITF